jgi:hypothetical protein
MGFTHQRAGNSMKFKEYTSIIWMYPLTYKYPMDPCLNGNAHQNPAQKKNSEQNHREWLRSIILSS